MTRLYKIDKSFCLKYIAASENIRLSYTNATLENIKKQSAKKANQRQKQRIPQDKLALHGPPDKTSNFKGRKRQCETENYSLSPPTKKTLDSESTGEITNVPDSSLMMKFSMMIINGTKVQLWVWNKLMEFGIIKSHFLMEILLMLLKMIQKSVSHNNL